MLLISMKTFSCRIILSSCVVLVVLVSICLYRFNLKSMDLENNVEALSESETGDYKKCWLIITYDPSDTEMYCGTCSVLPGRFQSGMSFCK